MNLLCRAKNYVQNVKRKMKEQYCHQTKSLSLTNDKHGLELQVVLIKLIFFLNLIFKLYTLHSYNTHLKILKILLNKILKLQLNFFVVVHMCLIDIAVL